MIKNLPRQISLAKLQEFNFGDVEANDDDLLFDSVCKTFAINEFLNGKRNIVLGEKGTGKTALFRLLKEEKLRFTKRNGCRNILIPIDDNFQYKNIKGKLLKLIDTDSEEEGFKYQIVWELFLFYRIVQKLKNASLGLPKSVEEADELLDKVFSKNGLDGFLKNKKTIGVKLYDTPTSIMPDFYVTSEPIAEEESIKEKSVEKLEIDLDKYKREINEFLVRKDLKIIILLDRLDEFVSRSAIPIQLELLEALISVEREYSAYSNIELKIFLRDDLFKQLSFDTIGGFDKVVSKKIDLIWTPENIREFISKRILSNFLNLFDKDHLSVTVDRQNLEIDASLENDNMKPGFFGKLYWKFIKKVKPEVYQKKYPRTVNLDDDINIQLMATILPTYVSFRNEEGKAESITLLDFFAHHFNLGTGNSIPRLALIFLEKIISVTANYYLKNSDQMPIHLNGENRFDLIKEGFFEEAYELFKEDIYVNFSKLNPEFERLIMKFKDKIGNRHAFRAKELKGLLGITDENELYHFCDYMEHIGMFKRVNKNTTIENMKYELPPIFRRTKG